MVYQKPVSPNGVLNLAKNAIQKPSRIQDAPNDLELMKENLRLRKELEEAKKENLFLKKSSGILAKEID